MERTVEILEQELKTEHDLYLRALADFENYRRRTDRERAQFGKEALRRFILPLLDVIDDLERLLNFAETN
ncbi:MAG TPA: nucleotide exchange factor GrpE, partial [Terriglobia bacterium]|nr:nucleotide exchange factor GrpE [Terriglobia bacterium]